MIRFSIRISIWGALILCFVALVQAQNNNEEAIVVDGSIHSPAEIMRLLIQSNLTYNISQVEDN